MFFNIHEQFLGPDHVAEKTIEAERKLQNQYYDGKKKGWDWDKYLTHQKEQQALRTIATVA